MAQQILKALQASNQEYQPGHIVFSRTPPLNRGAQTFPVLVLFGFFLARDESCGHR